MCMTGGTVGKNILLENIDEDLYTNQRVATIKIKEGFIPKFVYSLTKRIFSGMKCILYHHYPLTTDNSALLHRIIPV